MLILINYIIDYQLIVISIPVVIIIIFTVKLFTVRSLSYQFYLPIYLLIKLNDKFSCIA